MKYILSAFLLLAGLSLSAQTNADYCLLKIYRGVGSNRDSVKVKVYNQEAFNVSPNTLVIFKIYSEGGFVISASNGLNVNSNSYWGYNFSGNSGGPSWFLQFEHGKVICMMAGPSGGNHMLRQVKEKAFNSRIASANPTVIELEEDMEKPIKKTEKYSK